MWSSSSKWLEDSIKEEEEAKVKGRLKVASEGC